MEELTADVCGSMARGDRSRSSTDDIIRGCIISSALSFGWDARASALALPLVTIAQAILNNQQGRGHVGSTQAAAKGPPGTAAANKSRWTKVWMQDVANRVVFDLLIW